MSIETDIQESLWVGPRLVWRGIPSNVHDASFVVFKHFNQQSDHVVSKMMV
jgi:hypothetical protein